MDYKNEIMNQLADTLQSHKMKIDGGLYFPPRSDDGGTFNSLGISRLASLERDGKCCSNNKVSGEQNHLFSSPPQSHSSCVIQPPNGDLLCEPSLGAGVMERLQRIEAGHSVMNERLDDMYGMLTELLLRLPDGDRSKCRAEA